MSKSLRMMTVGLLLAGVGFLAGCGSSTTATTGSAGNPNKGGSDEQRRRADMDKGGTGTNSTGTGTSGTGTGGTGTGSGGTTTPGTRR